MAVLICSVEERSVAQKYGIKVGDTLISINGNPINDVLDYRFYMTDSKLDIELLSDGNSKKIAVKKSTYTDLGLDFDDYLMDKQKTCKNKCIFCFVDQLPKGMRETVYFKDDDSRMSFLFGNYITLTNMTEQDIERIIKMHISPINISVHTMNPELRVFMMKNKNAGKVLKYIYTLADAGIMLNTQIVLCPGVNDGKELEFTLNELGKLYPNVQSVAAVPVGVTKHRDGLYEMEQYNKQTATDVIDIMENFSNKFKEKNDGAYLAMASDEFYIKAQRELPSYDDYGEFPQHENGVGMIRLLTNQFESELEYVEDIKPKEVTISTGILAKPFIENLAQKLMNKFPQVKISVVGIINNFFGSSITVAGLVTGRDLIEQMQGKIVGNTLLIPSDMLRFEQDLFLDGTSVKDVESALGINVVIVENDGQKLLDAIVEGV